MRRIAILMLLLMSLPIITHGQSSRIDCETGEYYENQVSLIPPAIAADAFTQYIVSVMGVGDFNPIIAIDAPGFPILCNIAAETATLYSMTLPTVGDIPSSVNNTQDFVMLPGQSTIQIGEVNNNLGEFIILIEGNFDPTTAASHSFTLPITDAILNSGITPTAYLFALTPDFAPALTITSQEGELIAAMPVEEAIRLQSLAGLSETAMAATLPETVGDVELTVDSNGTEGLYALAIHLKTGEPTIGDGLAQAVDNDDGSITLSCNGNVVSENAVRVNLPDDGETYTVTAVGLVTFDPIMGLVDDNGNGRCFDNTETAFSYAVTLPTIGMDGSIFSAQTIVAEDARHVIVGSRDTSSGEFIIMVEGGQVDAGDDGDIFGVHITPAMINISTLLTTYVVATEDGLNPMLSYVNRAGDVMTDDSEAPYQCDNAGIPDNCYGHTIALRDYSVTVGDNITIPTLEVDALLQLPINETLTGATFPIRVDSSQETSGTYIVIFHIITL